MNQLEITGKTFISDKDINKVVKDVFDGKLQEGTIPKELYDANFNALSESVSGGYGSIAYDTNDPKMILQLKNNVAVFSAFKSNAHQSEMHGLLVDGDGNKRSWFEFQKEAEKVNTKYNQLWLEAEYNLATRQARSAKQWQDFEAKKDLYPNLQYLPSRSAKQRDAHKPYYYKIFPIDDPIWNSIMPPNGWGCKCSVKQTRDDATNNTGIEPLEPIAGIAGNSGKSGTIFSPSHPYIKDVSLLDKKAIKQQLNQLKADNTELINVKVGKNGLLINTSADISDLKDNINYSVPFIKKYKSDMTILADKGAGSKNPEFSFKNTIGDRTLMSGDNVRNYIDNSFIKLKKGGQLRELKNNFLGLDFNGKLNKENINQAIGQLTSKMTRYSPQLKFVLLKNGDKVLKLDNKKKLDLKDVFEKIKRELL